MKIAFVSQPIDPILPPFQNSVGGCTYGAACSLAKANDVTVYGLQGPNSASESVQRGVRFRFLPSTPADRFKSRLRTKFSKLVQLSLPFSVSPWFFPDFGRDVARELAKEQFDVIHIQHCSQYVPVIRELNPRAKIVLQLHAEWFSQCKPARLGTRLRGLDLLTTVSDHITKKTRRDLPSLAARCETIYNGINIDEFAAEREYSVAAEGRIKRIMYAGGISPHKGLHVLLDAFKIVAAQYPDVRLDIIGPHGSYPLEETFDLRDRALIRKIAPFYAKNRLSLLKSKLSRSTRSSGYLPYLQSKIAGSIADKVTFLGMIPRPELIRHYYTADVFVFPPIWDEGFGIPPVEAMAAGTPVVATRSGAIVETVQHGETGLLVAKNDPESLAQALLTLLTDDARRERMGRAGRRRATTQFTWDCAADKMHRLYNALCSTDALGKTEPAERFSLLKHQFSSSNKT